MHGSPPGWYADPLGRALLRYHDGAGWTDRVIHGNPRGSERWAGVDPIGPGESPAAPAGSPVRQGSPDLPAAAARPVQDAVDEAAGRERGREHGEHGEAGSRDAATPREAPGRRDPSSRGIRRWHVVVALVAAVPLVGVAVWAAGNEGDGSSDVPATAVLASPGTQTPSTDVTPSASATPPATASASDGPGDLSDWGIATIRPAMGLAVGPSGTVYVTDPADHTLVAMAPTGQWHVLAGVPGTSGSADGAGGSAHFAAPAAVAVDAAGSIWVADSGAGTVRRVSPDGRVVTVAGQAPHDGIIPVQGDRDGTGPAAGFDSPTGIAAGSDGTVYVTDIAAGTLRRVDSGGRVTTLAGAVGTGVFGARDGTGASAAFAAPSAVAAGPGGRLYVADLNDSSVRLVTPAGEVRTVARGPRDTSALAEPAGIAVDRHGVAYVTDAATDVVLKVDGSGAVSIFAGDQGRRGTADGVGRAARFTDPSGIAVGADGAVYVADNGGVRRITPDGAVTTIATLESG